MLGKGLESLIPNKGNSQSDNGAAQPLPITDPARELPAGFEAQLPAHEHGEPLILSIFPQATPVKDDAIESEVMPEVVPEPTSVPQVQLAAIPSFTPTTPIVSPVAHDSTPQAGSKHYEAIFHIEVEKIRPNPHQPRRHFDESAITDLAASIREFGILQPLVVTKIVKEVPSGTQVEYELIAGERRLLAARKLGLERVPAVIKQVDIERERLEMAIIENLQRENLSPIEMARAYSRLQDEFRLTQREIATRLGKSREVVANTVRLLDLPQDIQDAIDHHRISESHGRLLLAIDEPAVQQKVFSDLVEKHLTTRELKERVDIVRKSKGAGRPALGDEPLPVELQQIQDRLSSELGTPVKISRVGDSGKITISFYSQEELQSILHKLQAEED